MFEIGYKIKYLTNNNQWRSVFVPKNVNIDTLGININKIDTTTKTIRLKPTKLDIDTQLIVINKLQGLVLSGLPFNVIYKNILKDIPNIKIPNEHMRISDFLKLCKFSSEVVSIAKSSELSGNIDAGLEYIYDYLKIQKNNSKKLKASFKKNIIITIVTIFALALIPSYLVDILINLQGQLTISTNFMTSIIFWLAKYGLVMLITISILVLFLTNNNSIKSFASKNKIKFMQDYGKLKESISFLIVFKLLHNEGLDFKSSLQVINKTQNTKTTNNIYQKINRGNNLSTAIKLSDFPEELRLAFFGFEQNINLRLQISILDRLISMFSEMLETKNNNIANIFDILTTLLMGGFILLLMFGFLIPIMSSMGQSI